MSKPVRHPERGHRLRAAREHAGLTQEALCDAVNALPGKTLVQSHYSKYEAGKVKPEDDEMVRRLAAVLKVNGGWLSLGSPLGGPNPEWYRSPSKPHHEHIADERHPRRAQKKRREG